MIKQLITIVYIYLFVTHIILGPYWYLYSIENKTPIYFTDSVFHVVKRTIYITYVALLSFTWFLYYPTTEHYYISLLLTLFAFLLFTVFRSSSKIHYYHSVYAHFLMLIPFLFSYRLFNINLSKLKLTKSTAIFVVYMVFLLSNMEVIYS